MPAALVLVLAPVLAVVVFAGGVFAERTGVLGAPAAAPTATPAPGADANLALIDEAWRTIHDNYVDAEHLDNQELAYAAIRGMADAVGDEGHTQFMTADEAKAVDQSLSGQFVGIGVQVNQADDKSIQIRSVFPNTPAEEAGLQRGDVIKAVDGKTTEGETLDQTISRVRGPEGEDVTLTIGRDGQGRLRRHDHPAPVRPAARVVGHGPGHGHRGDPARAVRERRHRRGQGLDLGRQGGGRQEDHLRPARQPRRLRRRGRRRGEPVRGRRGRVPGDLARRHVQGQPGPAGRPRDRHPAHRPHRRRHRELRGDRDRAPSRTPAGRRSSARRRSGPGRSSAASTSRTGRRSGSASSAGSPATGARSGTRGSRPT